MLMCSATPFYPEEFANYSFRQQRELPHLSQKVLLCEIKSNLVMMSERKSTLSHQWAMSERVS